MTVERTGRERHTGKALLLIPSYAKRVADADVQEDRHPTMDYYALQANLGADLADYSSVATSRHSFVRAAAAASLDAGLAVLGFLRSGDYDVIFSNGENVSIPLAALLALRRSRPGHVLIGHRLSASKKAPFLRTLQSQMDAIFLYSASQRRHAEHELKLPAEKLHLIPFHADTRFYRPMPGVRYERRICSAGLELRDYPTLVEAVRGLDVEVRLAAASPWSKRRNETVDRALPSNVDARGYGYGELRDLYASAQLVVVPLYENDFQAGVTTILEAMAMGKAVIVSRTTGQTDVIDHDFNGWYVPPGDVVALRRAIVHLLEHPAEADRLGAAARRTVESTMSLTQWVERVACITRSCARRT
jgi:glycosyltransferase involved in cell wall biosynthesis